MGGGIVGKSGRRLYTIRPLKCLYVYTEDRAGGGPGTFVSDLLLALWVTRNEGDQQRYYLITRKTAHPIMSSERKV